MEAKLERCLIIQLKAIVCMFVCVWGDEGGGVGK